MDAKARAPRNRTISLSQDEVELYQSRLLRINGTATFEEIQNTVINQDTFDVLHWLPDTFVDVLFLDPPYNLTKSFNSTRFTGRSVSAYAEWLDSWFPSVMRTLKSTASVYICGDWRSSGAIHQVAEKHLNVRNRITWEREKGRGAKANWKNCSEDIWFCTVSESYTFNVETVKLRRRVLAPYTDESGNPKDWATSVGGDFRLTHPSNLWTDLTVPFWSMPENTDHPTQKPEKLLAKVILASSNLGDVIFDPFLGSGTTAATAKKLNRRFVGIEIDPFYCAMAMKRLHLAETEVSIQGYLGGVFWERNALPKRNPGRYSANRSGPTAPLFDATSESSRNG